MVITARGPFLRLPNLYFSYHSPQRVLKCTPLRIIGSTWKDPANSANPLDLFARVPPRAMRPIITFINRSRAEIWVGLTEFYHKPQKVYCASHRIMKNFSKRRAHNQQGVFTNPTRSLCFREPHRSHSDEAVNIIITIDSTCSFPTTESARRCTQHIERVPLLLHPLLLLVKYIFRLVVQWRAVFHINTNDQYPRTQTHREQDAVARCHKNRKGPWEIYTLLFYKGSTECNTLIPD